MLCSKLYALGLPSSVENATLPSRNGEISLYSLVQNARDSDSPFLPSGKSGKPYVSRHVALFEPSVQLNQLLSFEKWMNTANHVYKSSFVFPIFYGKKRKKKESDVLASVCDFYIVDSFIEIF